MKNKFPNDPILVEYLKNNKRLRRILRFVPPTAETETLLRHMDFIDETIDELGPKGKALIYLYHYNLSWENASKRLFVSPHTLGRWRNDAFVDLRKTIDAAGIDLKEFDPYLKPPASGDRIAAKEAQL